MIPKDIIIQIFKFLDNDTNKKIQSLYYPEIPNTYCITSVILNISANLSKYINVASASYVLKEPLENYSEFLEKIYDLRVFRRGHSENFGLKTVPVLKRLRTLFIQNHYIEELPKELTNLKFLDVSLNPIKEISYTYNNLIYLNISGTKVSNIPNTFPYLEYLNCSRTSVDCIPELLLLKYLDCSYTNVCEIPEELISLQYLNCINTKISAIPETLEELVEINIGGPHRFGSHNFNNNCYGVFGDTFTKNTFRKKLEESILKRDTK